MSVSPTRFSPTLSEVIDFMLRRADVPGPMFSVLSLPVGNAGDATYWARVIGTVLEEAEAANCFVDGLGVDNDTKFSGQDNVVMGIAKPDGEFPFFDRMRHRELNIKGFIFPGAFIKRKFMEKDAPFYTCRCEKHAKKRARGKSGRMPAS